MKICVLVIFGPLDFRLRTMKRAFLLGPLFLFMLVPISDAQAEHVLGMEAYGQFLDISQLEAEKSSFEFDGIIYDIYYGYHGSMDDSMTEVDLGEPAVSDMVINQERKSIEVRFSKVPEKTDFWLRIPFDVLTAEKEQYQVLIDGKDTGYDLMKMPDGYVVGMVIAENTKHVEIVGTKVIPEFGNIATLVLGISILGIVYYVRKSPFRKGWTRIN